MTLESVPKKGRLTSSRVVDGEAVVFLPGKQEMRILNKVGTFIWELVDGERSVVDIVDSVCEKHEVERGTAEHDALEFLNALLERNMVECP